jgi:hypothetical protein
MMVDKPLYHVNTGEFLPLQSECAKCDTTPVSKLRVILVLSLKPERASHSANIRNVEYEQKVVQNRFLKFW